MSKQQTAVEWLYDQIPSIWTTKKSSFDTFKQALQMEEEQKKIDYEMGYINGSLGKNIDGQDYYNETYKP